MGAFLVSPLEHLQGIVHLSHTGTDDRQIVRGYVPPGAQLPEFAKPLFCLDPPASAGEPVGQEGERERLTRGEPDRLLVGTNGLMRQAGPIEAQP